MFRLKFRKRTFIKILVPAALGLLFAANRAPAQVCKGPILKSRLLVALKSKMQNAQQLTSYINQCGVDFSMTPDVESELVAAGARPAVIEPRVIITVRRQT